MAATPPELSRTRPARALRGLQVSEGKLIVRNTRSGHLEGARPSEPTECREARLTTRDELPERPREVTCLDQRRLAAKPTGRRSLLSPATSSRAEPRPGNVDVRPARRRRTPGISCELQYAQRFVCFIPLFGGLVARRDEPFDARATAPDCCDTPMRLLTNPGWRPQGAPSCLECRNSERARSWRVHNAPTLVERRQPATYEDAFSTSHSNAGAQTTCLCPRPGPVWPTQHRARLARQIAVAPAVAQQLRRRRSRDTGSVRRTPGISCERPICSTLVCFIPLFDGLVARRDEPFDARATAPDCCDTPMRLLTNPGWRPQGAPSPRMPQQRKGSVLACPQRADPRREAPARDLRG